VEKGVRKMDFIEGVYVFLEGIGKLQTEDNLKISLLAFKPLKLLHPLHGWVPCIYQGDGIVVHPQGKGLLQNGDAIRIMK
jgi:hypothetical protein